MRILLHTLLAAFYCCLAISSLPTQAQEIWNGEIDKNLQGTGSVSDPFLIKTANQLAGLAERVNAGEDFKDKHIRLDADLFMSDASKPSAEKKQWTPISGIFYNSWEHGSGAQTHSTLEGTLMVQGTPYIISITTKCPILEK